jgi:L-threonylcarbamoyladenylate synthase
MPEDPTALQPTPTNAERVADCIRDGGVAVVPGDTNMTFAVDPDSEAAVERVYALKGRDRDSPLSLLHYDPAEWRRYGRTDHADVFDALVDAFLPGPLNVIVERTDDVPGHVVSGFETVCLGSFRNDAWRAVASRVSPVAATSANISGEADDALVDVATALDHVGEGADVVLGGEGLDWTTQSTTIVDLSGEPTVFREGDVTRADLNDVRDVF